jgi:hypothetical protein
MLTSPKDTELRQMTKRYPPRGPALFRQSDVAKAMNVAKDQGLEIGAIEITKTGTIRVIAKSAETAQLEKTDTPESVLNQL